jgi:hypothetical protein
LSLFKKLFQERPTLSQPVESQSGSWERHFSDNDKQKIKDLERSENFNAGLGFGQILLGGAVVCANPILGVAVFAFGVARLLAGAENRADKEDMIKAKMDELALKEQGQIPGLHSKYMPNLQAAAPKNS